MRAFLKGFVQSGRPEGGSTITQQLARVLFLNQDLSLQRKYKEILIARKLESNWTKNQILEVYLNRIYLGRGTWGVGLAAQQYFGKEVSELKLHESAFLAGIANGPNYYEPTENSKRALQRRSYVLKQMQNAGWISSRERALASKKAIGAKSSWIPAGIQKGGHFQQLARSEFNELFKGRNLSKYQGSGFEVVTTLHESLQEELERALRDGLIAYEERTGRHEWRGPMIYLNYEVNRRIEKLNKEQEEIAEKEKRVKELQSSSVFSLFQSDQSKEKATSQPQKSVFDRAWLGVFQEMTRIHRAALPHLKETPWKKAMILEAKEDDIYSIGFLNGDKGVLDLNAKVSLQGKKYPRDQKWVLSRHPNPRIAQLELGDVVWVERNDEGRFELRQVPEVQGAAIAMDPKTGRILAMSGSFDYGTSPFNRAVQAKRRIGSTMKTFSYMAALESGLQPDHLISNQPIEFDPIVQGGKAWRPSNYSGEYSSCHSMRYGLTRSKNVMTARLLKQMSESPRESLDFVRSISKDFGLYDDPIRQYPFVLGAQETSLLKLVTAYARIANGGVKVKARAIDRIKEVSGESTLYSADEREHGRISEVDEVSILQTKNLLKGVLSHGTASRLSKWSGEMAGKTGTTDDFNDAWFVAFTDHLVVGAWVGYDNAEIESARNLGSRQTGSKVALPIVEDIFEGSMESYKEISPLSTLNSKEVVSVEVNPKTGRQVEPGDENSVTEYIRWFYYNNPKRVGVCYESR
jgi:membrane carboxypeptidase/penicillin-binding protein